MSGPAGELRHFGWMTPEQASALFHSPPQPFERHGDDAERLAMALGATLYMPATRRTIAADMISLANRGVVSVVLCLEDAIPDDAIAAAEANLVVQLQALASTLRSEPACSPMIFVRVREPVQLTRVVRQLHEHAQLLSGFVLPKFDPDHGRRFLEEIEALSGETGVPFRSMPVLESAQVLRLESRLATLLQIRSLLAAYERQILAVRIGVTDLLAVYGLRRGRDMTVYEIPLVAQALADIVNVLGCPTRGHVVTGPVWERFATSDRLFKPQLRQTPFEVRDATGRRSDLLTRDIDGLIREATLDRANGLVGKTVIHPSHVLPVHALSVVTYEEYRDAVDIIDDLESGGVRASAFGNKMNEGKPHAAWARRTLLRAELFGAAAPDATLDEFLLAGDQRSERGSR